MAKTKRTEAKPGDTSKPWDWARTVFVDELLKLAHLGEHARGVAPVANFKGKVVQLGPPPPAALAEVVGHVVARALRGWEVTAWHREQLVVTKPRDADKPTAEGARSALALWLKFIATENTVRRELAVLAMAALLALEDHESVCADAFAEEPTKLLPRRKASFTGRLARGLLEHQSRLERNAVRKFVLKAVGGVWVCSAQRLEDREAEILATLTDAFIAATPTRPMLVLLPETRPYKSGRQNRVRIVPVEGEVVTDWLAVTGADAAADWGGGRKAERNGQTKLVTFLRDHRLPTVREKIDIHDARGN